MAPFVAAALLVALLVALSGCGKFRASMPPGTPGAANAPAEGAMSLHRTPYERLPGWKGDHHSSALPPLIKSCQKLAGRAPDEAMGPAKEMGHVSDWLPICRDAQLIRPGNDTEAQYFFESRFDAYLVNVNLNPRGLFTGYFEPELHGSWTRDQRYRHPIFSRPKDLLSAALGAFDEKWRGQHIAGRLEGNKLVPYLTRDEIDNGALTGRQLEILWIDNPIDAFFVHIQGSGRVTLADGSHVRIGYAGRNGHRYTAIGRELVAMRAMKLKDVTMPAIRTWLEANPVGGQAVMKRNKAYIFFRIIDGDGPIGAQGVVLTAGRSLAVDRKYIPLGIPLWLATTEPGTKREKPLCRLVIAQDTGSAIKGPVRGDLFWGYGREAGEKAGLMKEQGQYFLLLPKRPSPGS